MHGRFIPLHPQDAHDAYACMHACVPVHGAFSRRCRATGWGRRNACMRVVCAGRLRPAHSYLCCPRDCSVSSCAVQSDVLPRGRLCAFRTAAIDGRPLPEACCGPPLAPFLPVAWQSFKGVVHASCVCACVHMERERERETGKERTGGLPTRPSRTPWACGHAEEPHMCARCVERRGCAAWRGGFIIGKRR